MRHIFGNWGGQGRTVALLSACWAPATSGNVLLVSTSALAGYMLAPDKALATLPIAFQWFGTAGATIPASFLMRRVGRRLGFAAGAGVGITGVALTMAAIFYGNFALLCLGIGLLGAFNGFMIFGSAGLGTFLAGGLLHFFGWTVLNLAALPLALVVAVAALVLLARRRKMAAAAA